MSPFGRVVTGLAGALAGSLLSGASPASASGTLQLCMNQSINHNGEPPTCTNVNGNWVPSWSSDLGSGGDGVMGMFIFLFVVGLIASVGVAIWRVSTARRLAAESGMDPGLATQMTLLSDDGLDATYLAASLRQRPTTPPPPRATSVAPAPPTDASSAADRLLALKSLLDQSLVTQDEYDQRRREIIDTV